MPIPTADVNNSNTASGSTPGMPAAFRLDTQDLINKFNALRQHLVDLRKAREQSGVDGGFLVSSTASNALTIALKTEAAVDPSATYPVTFLFPTSSGGFNLRSVSARLSLTVPAGATLGHASGFAGSVHVYALDNSGAVELAVSSRYHGAEFTGSTTALSGSSNSASLLYSTSARTSRSMRHLGLITFTNTTAGQWSAAFGIALRASSLLPISLVRSKASNQTFSTSATLVTFPTAEIDTAAMWDSGNNAYMPRETGEYIVEASLGILGNAGGANNITVEIRVNGTAVRTFIRPVATSATENIHVFWRGEAPVGHAITIYVTSSASICNVAAAGTQLAIKLESR